MCINDCCQFSKNLINYNVSFILITKSHSSGIFFRVSNLVADIRYFRRIWIGQQLPTIHRGLVKGTKDFNLQIYENQVWKYIFTI